MAAETRTFTGVTRAKIDALRDRLSSYAELPPGDSGTIERQGMRGSYRYDESAQTLTLTLDEVPFFVPRGMIWSTVENALNG